MNPVQFGRRPHFTVLALERKSAGDVRQCFTKLTSHAADFRQQPVVEGQANSAPVPSMHRARGGDASARPEGRLRTAIAQPARMSAHAR